jgi:hypothetical protein
VLVEKCGANFNQFFLTVVEGWLVPEKLQAHNHAYDPSSCPKYSQMHRDTLLSSSECNLAHKFTIATKSTT